MKDTFMIYFAGSLFNHKDLIGNALLAKFIEKNSAGKYRCWLPQNAEQHQTTALDIRDKDILKLIESDLGLFCFDGTELDAGVVVEFMIAKFLDIPAVILRTDFRTCGEKEVGGENWNFMCSFYPRTRVLNINSIQHYQEALEKHDSLKDAIDFYCISMADRILENLDAVKAEPPLLKDDPQLAQILYNWALRFPGMGIDSLPSDKSFADRIVAAKIGKGLV